MAKVDRFASSRRILGPDGMDRAYQNLRKYPVTLQDIQWTSLPMQLPVSEKLIEKDLLATVDNPQAKMDQRIRAARSLAWLYRRQRGEPVNLSCLRLGETRIIHAPRELFVEYQLAAQQMRPDLFICMAAYGDCGPGYIGTEIAYNQGGYETGPVSRVSPKVGSVIMSAVRKLLR